MASLRLALCAAALSLCLPGVSFACLGPPLERYLLWPAKPARLEPGEVVIEVGPAPPRSETAAAKGKGLQLNTTIWTYDVARVLAGRFEGRTVAVDWIQSSCSRWSAADTPSAILVGRVVNTPAGRPLLRPREMRYGAPEHEAAARKAGR